MRLIPALECSDTEKAVLAARTAARATGKNVSLAITDSAGVLFHFERIGNPHPVSVRIAKGKAVCAALSSKETGIWEEIVTARPVLGALPDILPVRGGLPIMIGDDCLGGIGVAGASSEEDEHIARAAVAAILEGSDNV